MKSDPITEVRRMREAIRQYLVAERQVRRTGSLRTEDARALARRDYREARGILEEIAMEED